MAFFATRSVALSSLTYPFWRPPIDPVLALLYVAYGVALIHASFQGSGFLEQVRFSEIHNALKTERIAGAMLLISACIDISLAVDFSFFSGEHALKILSIGHAVLLPTIAIAVVMISLSIAPSVNETINGQGEKPTSTDKVKQQLTDDEVKKIVDEIVMLLTSKEVFLDPDLTLARLARKAGIPARQISIAINQVYGRNVSQVVNEYRIERAKTLLISSDKSITQIYLDSGFQSKSNFNREFSRITEQTPSAFRRSHQSDTLQG